MSKLGHLFRIPVKQKALVKDLQKLDWAVSSLGQKNIDLPIKNRGCRYSKDVANFFFV